MWNVTQHDKDILRSLAGRLAAIAALPVQKETEKLYRAVNSLRMIRPVVLLDELPWNQLNDGGELTLHCEDEYLRSVEQGMRRTLYKWDHCRGDMLVEPYFDLRREISVGNMGITIKEKTLADDSTNHIVSHAYADQLSTMESLECLHVPEITVDDELTGQKRALSVAEKRSPHSPAMASGDGGKEYGKQAVHRADPPCRGLCLSFPFIIYLFSSRGNKLSPGGI